MNLGRRPWLEQAIYEGCMRGIFGDDWKVIRRKEQIKAAARLRALRAKQATKRA